MRSRAVIVRVAIAAIGLGGAGALLLAVPDNALAWAGAVATAAAGALGKKSWDIAGDAIKKRRAAWELETADPFVVDVRVKNLDYVIFVDSDRTEEIPASGHTVQLVVTGTLAKPVLLTDIRVSVVSRADRTGALSRHAAEIPKRRFEVLLDAEPPRVRAVGDSDFPFELKQQESEAFDLKVTTKSGEVQWLLSLDWRSGRRSGSTEIDLGGTAFRTAGRHVRRSRR
jgi:hypothetical protein